ncbi:MAG: bifunctional adenosylcobinamide kinase/adenosylcobinamide-phosphate guanylyltransferase [Candidatus Limnocylindrales bacterium]
MGRIVLVTGGARSGKSAFAETLAARRGERVVYLATATVGDAEMEERIARHRARRPAGWVTLEAPLDIGASLAAVASGIEVVLVDCLAVWAANRLLAIGEPAREGWWDQVATLERGLTQELDLLVTTALAAAWDLLLVTNEVGFGIVPPTELGRAYRDLLGRLNQVVAARADEVYLVVAGLAVDMKQLAAETQRG